MPLKKCKDCGDSFKSFRGQQKFCSRKCYDTRRVTNKKCKDCGKDRCSEHARLKTAKWRVDATEIELKARSMQSSYRYASGRQGSLSLDEARKIIADPPDCPYCGVPIPFVALSIDHKIPLSRGGSNEHTNLVWVDLSCNMMKGNLTDVEFTELMGFLKDRPKMRKILSTRLRAGGFIYKKQGK